MKESSVESYFTGRIKALGGESRKVKWIGRRGAPDQLPLLAGICPTLVELKAPGKKPRPEQLREHERLRKAGYIGVGDGLLVRGDHLAWLRAATFIKKLLKAWPDLQCGPSVDSIKGLVSDT